MPVPLRAVIPYIQPASPISRHPLPPISSGALASRRAEEIHTGAQSNLPMNINAKGKAAGLTTPLDSSARLSGNHRSHFSPRLRCELRNEFPGNEIRTVTHECLGITVQSVWNVSVFFIFRLLKFNVEASSVAMYRFLWFLIVELASRSPNLAVARHIILIVYSKTSETH